MLTMILVKSIMEIAAVMASALWAGVLVKMAGMDLLARRRTV